MILRSSPNKYEYILLIVNNLGVYKQEERVILDSLTFEARPRTGILLALASQTARVFQIVLSCHIVTTACMGLAGVMHCCF